MRVNSRPPVGLFNLEAPMRKFALSSILTMAMFLITAVSVLADSTGPGV